MDANQTKRIVETALLCAQEPITTVDLTRLFVEDVSAKELEAVLLELQGEWQESGMELVRIATGWRFQSRLSMREYLDRLTPEKPPKYSRAVMETLAIIAYRQPLTRAQVDAIRGVDSSGTLRVLLTRDLVSEAGRRETVGRPILYATTSIFLQQFGLTSLTELPPMEIPHNGE